MSGITYSEHLELRAHNYWRNGAPLPTNLFADMLGEGLDVAALERQFYDHNVTGEDE